MGLHLPCVVLICSVGKSQWWLKVREGHFKNSQKRWFLFSRRLSTEEATRWADSFDVLLSHKCE